MPVKLIGLEKGEENLVVGGGVVHGVAGDSCHGWKMLAGEVSVVVDATYEDNYEIYRPITTTIHLSHAWNNALACSLCGIRRA